MSTRKRTPKIADYGSKCEAPAQEFLKFAKGITSPQGKRSLETLVASAAAEKFAKRLLEEALSGERHAASHMKVVGHLAKDHRWVDKFRASEVAGSPPSPNQVPARDAEPIGRALLVLFPAEALSWIAVAYLTMKGGPAARFGLQSILVEAAPTPHTLIKALSFAVEEIEPKEGKIPSSVVARSVELVEAYADKRSLGASETETKGLARLAGFAKRAEMTRFLAAFLSFQVSEPENDGDTSSETEAIGEAAWSQADDALARALQNIAALKYAVDHASEVDPKVKGYGGVVSQAVRSAAAKRELELDGVIGATTHFDPVAHQSDDPSIGSEVLVRIMKPAVVQGRQTWRRMIRKAEVVRA